MTDLAPIVITALIVIIVLQIISMNLILEMKKEKAEKISPEKPVLPDQRDFKRPREGDNRFAKKPVPEQKAKPVPAQNQNPNTDHVERSLRDINLRLKNAEKDQEKERKRIKDTISHSSSPRRFDNPRSRERDDNFRRNDQPRQSFQHNRNESSRPPREDGSFNRNQSENRQQKPNDTVAAVTAPVTPAPTIVPAITIPVAPIVQIPLEPPSQAVEKPIEPIFDNPSLPETAQNLHHGRKVLVKRRILNVEENQGNESGEASASKNEDTVQQSIPEQIKGNAEQPKSETENASSPKEPSDNDESYSKGPISFGR
jgi:hypothetical protein